MAIESIQYATVRVVDLDSAIAFYTQELGLTLRSDWPFGDGQRFVTVGPGTEGGAGIILAEATAEAPAGGLTGVVLGAADVERTAGELAARGVPLPQPAARQEWGAMMALLSDPDGNVLVLHDA